MRKLLAPIVLICVCIALTRLTVRIAPYLVGIDTLSEQVNGTIPAGMWYVVGLESLSVIFNLAAIFCAGWLLVRIVNILKERTLSHEKQ